MTMATPGADSRLYTEQTQEVTANGAVSENAQSHLTKSDIEKWWTAKKEQAAQLLAEDRITDTEICLALNITRDTLCRWKKHPEFQARVEQIRKRISNYSLRLLIGRKIYRLTNYQEHLHALQQIRAERAADPSMQGVAGAESGLIVRQYKQIGKGKDAEIVEEYKFDAALSKEIREVQEQAARELGQIVNKVAPTSPDGELEYRARMSEAEFDRLPLEERIRLLQSAIEHRSEDGAGGAGK